MKRMIALPGILLMTLASGCMYEMQDEITEMKIKCANHLSAKSAYYAMDTECLGLSCPHSFKEGFFKGYVDVANGGTGCVPAVPEIRCCNHMWMDFCTDNEKMEAWYDGYEHGAMAAKADGMADYNRTVTRIPQPNQLDYSMPGMSRPDAPAAGPGPDGSTDSSIPPAPVSDSESGDTQQTRKVPMEIFK